MRLLHRSETGEISLTNYLIGEGRIPPYAILSHTWSSDPDKEVTFQDMMNGTGEPKIGYKKIRFCGEQAMRDGLQYFWVDTCCIDKSSSAELSEAINSMYRWYKESQVCYVYLEDVVAKTCAPWILPDDEHLEEDERIRLEESDFAGSRWFTRGWTLQELLAPKNIEFYSKGWVPLGTLQELLAAVVHITKIDHGALSGNKTLSSFCIARKMSWAAKRQTTRPEDQAYCLMGIFEVQMPLLYGEGRRAFVRLQEEIIKYADDDSFLAWDVPSHITSEMDHRFDGLLAPSPAYFEGCGKLVQHSRSKSIEPWFMSNLGLTSTMKLIPTTSTINYYNKSQYCALLDCGDENDPNQRLALRGWCADKSDGTICVHPSKGGGRPRCNKIALRQLNKDNRSNTYKSIILLRIKSHDRALAYLDETITVTMDTTLLYGQIRTDHTISIKSYFPRNLWNSETTTLLRQPGHHTNRVFAVRLTFQGEDLLLILKSIHWAGYRILGAETPILVRYPHDTPGLRSAVSQIPKILTSKRFVYDGPLKFQYMQRKGEKYVSHLLLKAYLSNPGVSTQESESEPEEFTSVEFGGEVYVSWPPSRVNKTSNEPSLWNLSKYLPL